MKAQDIERAFYLFKTCPKCNSLQGFWVGSKRDHVYVQCKTCGTEFELYETYRMNEKNKKSRMLRFF